MQITNASLKAARPRFPFALHCERQDAQQPNAIG